MEAGRVHHDCRLGDVQRQSVDGWGNWGFAVLPNAAGGPVVSLTYETEAEARAAHALMANLPEALKSFRDGLAIAEGLAKADASNAVWQRDLSPSYDRTGDVIRQAIFTLG